MLKKNFDENSQKEFKERNINDTSFMSKFIKTFIQDNLDLKSNDKNKVICINGMLTNMLRYNWQVGNKCRKNHLHHAVDAIIIAFATQSEVQRLSSISAKNKEFIYKKVEEKSKKVKFEAPIENFRNMVDKSIEEIFVSFAPRKSITGEAHEQTIYSPKNYMANKKQEKPSVLTGGSVIRNVTLNDKSKIAKQSSMPRVDIFKHKIQCKFYVVPVYTSDFVKKTLPNKAIVAGKNKEANPKEWKEMDENYEFIFSIFKDELIEVKTKKETIKGYFISTDSATGSIKIKNHDNKEHGIFKRNSSNVCSKSIGIQNALSVKKFQVDALGIISEVKNEKRLGTKIKT